MMFPRATPKKPIPANPFAGAARKATLSEAERVCRLPVRGEATPPGDPPGEITRLLRLPEGTVTLRPIQERALAELRACGGLLGAIGVGHGKSLIAILAGAILNAELAVILCPPSSVDQLRQALAEARRHFRVPETRVVSYSLLSVAKGTAMLEDVTRGVPDLGVVLVADEVHSVKRAEAARTKRVIRYLGAHPDVRFVALSGTMTSKSLRDFGHIAELALRAGSPVPRDSRDLDAWAECLDSGGKPGPVQWVRIAPLWRWAQTDRAMADVATAERQRILREAFQRRLEATPGVVVTYGGSVSCDLRIVPLSVPVPPAIAAALQRAEQAPNEDPDGEILPDDVSVWRVRRHLAQGFYYRWVWPGGVVDDEWLEARRGWGRAVRAVLAAGAREGYDSPLLVSQACARDIAANRRLDHVHRAWQRWARVKDLPAPPVEPVWLSEYLVAASLAWAATQGAPVILWYESTAMEAAFRAAGLPTYGAGTTPPRVAETCAMSIQAHGEGKNLQAWRLALVVCPPSGGKTWEQLLGRLHRQGQAAPQVTYAVWQHCGAFREAMDAARRDAAYIEAVSGNAQKLWTATLEPTKEVQNG